MIWELTRTVGVYGRVVSSLPTMAGNSAPTYGVATAGLGNDACRGQETLPYYQAGGLFLLWKMD